MCGAASRTALLRNDTPVLVRPSALTLNTPKLSPKRRKIAKFFLFAVGARILTIFFILHILNAPNLVLKMPKIAKIAFF